MYEEAGSTIMSILHGAMQPGEQMRRINMQRFAEQYTGPLVGYLRSQKGQPFDFACEVIQNFWLRKLIEPPAEENLIFKYLELKARSSTDQNITFRAFLMKSISRFLIDSHRKLRRDVSLLEGDQVAVDSPADQPVFDRIWANDVLKSVVIAVRDECLTNQQEKMWVLFLRQILLPNILNTNPPGYAELSRELGYGDPKQAANAVRTVVRKFQGQLKKRVCDYLPVDDSDGRELAIQREADELLGLLSTPGSLDYSLFDEIIRPFVVAMEPHRELGDEFSAFQPSELRSFVTPPEKSLYQNPLDLEVRWHQLLDTEIDTWLTEWEPFQRVCNARCFRDLAYGKQFPMEALSAVRDGAKLASQQNVDEPVQVLSLIYHLAIALGYQQHGRILSSDQPVKIKKRIQNFMDAEWLDSDSRSVLIQFMAAEELDR